MLLWAVSSRMTFPYSLYWVSSLYQGWIHNISRTKKAKSFLSVFAEANPPGASPAHRSFKVKVTTSRLVNPLDRPHIANALTSHPSGWHAASHPEEEAFWVQLWLPCLCSQTVFPFIPLSAYSVYFGALLHHGAWMSRRRKTSPWLPIQWHDCWKLLPPLCSGSAKDKKAEGSWFKGRLTKFDVYFIQWQIKCDNWNSEYQTGTKWLLLIKRPTTYITYPKSGWQPVTSFRSKQGCFSTKSYFNRKKHMVSALTWSGSH